MKEHVSHGKECGSSSLSRICSRIAQSMGKGILLLALAGIPLSMTSCTTDAYGNTAVTPGGAAAIGIGAAAAGAITAAAISNNNNKHHNYHHHHRPPPPPHYRPRPYHRR